VNRIRVIVPAYQRPEWLKVCLGSLAVQDHPDFDVTIVDDASPDPDVSLIANTYADRLDWRAIRAKDRCGALASRCAAVAAADPEDHDVLVFVDGDDWLYHASVLTMISDAIDDDNWMTFGTMMSVATHPDRSDRAAGLDLLMHSRRRWFESNRTSIVESAGYRRTPWCFTHPIACKAFLWKAIDPSVFRLNSGHWIRTYTDLVSGYPLLELSGGRFRFLDDVSYVYNVHAGNVEADPTRDRARAAISRWLRSLPPCESLDRSMIRPPRGSAR